MVSTLSRTRRTRWCSQNDLSVWTGWNRTYPPRLAGRRRRLARRRRGERAGGDGGGVSGGGVERAVLWRASERDHDAATDAQLLRRIRPRREDARRGDNDVARLDLGGGAHDIGANGAPARRRRLSRSAGRRLRAGSVAGPIDGHVRFRDWTFRQ